jgi:hypothetical protein
MRSYSGCSTKTMSIGAAESATRGSGIDSIVS